MVQNSLSQNSAPQVTTTVSYLRLTRPHDIGAAVHFPLVLRNKYGQTYRLVPWSTPEIEAYRAMYRAVGQAYGWWQRLALSDALLAEAINPHDAIIARLLDERNHVVGYAEWRVDDGKDKGYIMYFGLVPGHEGTGLAKPMMRAVQGAMWHDVRQPSEILVNTCTLDHPRALGFYQHLGFVVTHTQQVIFPDPRLWYDNSN